MNYLPLGFFQEKQRTFIFLHCKLVEDSKSRARLYSPDPTNSMFQFLSTDCSVGFLSSLQAGVESKIEFKIQSAITTLGKSC